MSKNQPITINFGGGVGQEIDFSTPEEIRDWTKQQIEKWHWLLEDEYLPAYSENSKKIFDDIRMSWNMAIEEIDSFLKSPTSIPKLANELSIKFRHAYGNNLGKGFPWPSSDKEHVATDIPNHLEDDVEKKQYIAGAIGGFLCGNISSQIDSGQPMYLGHTSSVLYKRLTPHIESVKSLQQQVEIDLQQTRHARDAHLETLKKTVRDLKTQALKADKDFHEATQKAEALYKTKEDLSGTSGFWNTQRKSHTYGFTWWFTGFFLIAISGPVLLFQYGLPYLASDIFSIPDTEGVSKSTTMSISAFNRVAALSLCSMVWAWLLRVCGRVAMSHRHLAADAQERSALIQTYTRLIGDEIIPSSEFTLNIMMKNVFRKAQTGLIQNDVVPSLTVEMPGLKSSNESEKK